MEYNLEKLPKEVEEVIVVVNYLKKQIMEYFGEEFGGRKITYVFQEETLGTGHAVKICEPFLEDRFLVLMGDDIYDEQDFLNCLNKNNCIVVKEIRGSFAGGKVKLNKQGFLEEIIEGKHEEGRHLANTSLYVLDHNFFKYDLALLEGKKEYGLPQTLAKMARDYPVELEKANFWHQINDLEGLNKFKKLLKASQ